MSKHETKTKPAPTTQKSEPITAAEAATALERQGITDLVEPDDFGDLEGRGFEGQEASLQKVPFLNILQPGSKLVKMPKKERPSHLKDIEAGWAYNPVTEEAINIVETPLEFLPIIFSRCFIRWKPEMGGFNGKLDPHNPAVKKAILEGSFGEFTIDGDQLQETVELFSLYRSPRDGVICAAVQSMYSTKLGVFKDWNARVSGVKLKKANGDLYSPPLFTHRTLLGSFYDRSRGEEQAFYRLTLTPAVNGPDGRPDYRASIVRRADERFIYAEKFHEDIVENRTAADYSTAEEGGGGGKQAASSGGDKRSDAGF
jgi:hypothetical protein